ncbi:MAG TPA: aspartate aminotransferase family protein [bacterium]|nr:aspartate aminotransferase family protein [bacterium]
MSNALETYLHRTPASGRLIEQARRVMPGGDTRTSAYWPPYPLFIDRGEGCRIRDVDGHVYVDFVNNYTSLILGHAHPAVLEAVTRELGRGTAYAAPLAAQIELAEVLVDRVPSLDAVRFCNSGTEATLFALRAARAFTGRERFIKIEGGFHGTHDAVEVSVSPGLDAAGPADDPRPVPASAGLPKRVLDDVVVVPFNDLAAVDRAFRRCPGEIASLIVEPAPGGLGYLPPAPGYLAGLRETVHRHGALLIFDEIQTLRLSRGGAQELFGVTPDLTTMGKIIGGGFPVGAFGGRRDVMDLFDPGRPGFLHHSGTFNGNRATVVAGAAVLRLLDQPQIERLNALGARLRAGLSETARASGIRAQVTGVGSFSSILFSDRPVTDYRSRAAVPAALQSLLHLHLLNRGIYSISRGSFSLCVPMTDAEIEACAAAVGDALREMRPDVERHAPHLLA